ncbi:MAG: hypothetical protein ACTIJ6_04860 [Leucobacter sp.]
MNDDLRNSLASAVASSPEDAELDALYADRLTVQVGEADAPRIVYTSESPARIVGYQPHGQGDGPIYAKNRKSTEDEASSDEPAVN